MNNRKGLTESESPTSRVGGLKELWTRRRFARPAADRGFAALGWRCGLFIILCAWLGWAGAPALDAQLALTEAMSWSSNRRHGIEAKDNSDFWELTNFGTHTIDLTDYLFCDRDRIVEEGRWRLPAMSIAPGESVIFLRGDGKTTNALAFRSWWGEANLPANLQIAIYPQPYSFGFDFLGDGVRLWDANTNLVDQVFFGEAIQGVTFTHDACGRFGVPGILGMCGAWSAPEYGDIGSPGVAECGPIPLSILRQPHHQSVDPGVTVTFSLEACGLPRPKCTWYFNGHPIPKTAVPGDTIPTVVNYAGAGLAWTPVPHPDDLTIPAVLSRDAGQYHAVLTNGLECITSAVVTLTVNTNPMAPWADAPPEALRFPMLEGQPWTNMVVFPWQTATFGVLPRGFPVPTVRWSWFTGTSWQELPGETNRTLVISRALPGHSGLYRVRLRNSEGTNDYYARLTVQDPPRLKITEASALAADPGRPNWWELSSYDSEPVNLYGYRWDDWPGSIGGGPTITNLITIQPGESIIFVESWSRDAFIRWWGADNLPDHLQVITYTANGLNEVSDEINLWDPMAIHDPSDATLDSWQAIDLVGVTHADRSPGRSFYYWPWDVCSERGAASAAGECGAFTAAETTDVGSPGWTAWTPPRLRSVQCDGAVTTLTWKAPPGSRTRVAYTPSLGPTPAVTWTDLGTFAFAGATGRTTHAAMLPVAATEGGFLAGWGFYRLTCSPCPCPCPYPSAAGEQWP